ncbi:MAG: hypothetical protein DDT19_01197 [Syntrophomonadaceae bacterium]|nr:hypothetical protein [Bacillota bacterium]
MRKVAVYGCGMNQFGMYEGGLVQMMAEVSLAAMDDAGVDKVDAVFVGNMGGGILNHQTGIASALVDCLSLYPAAAMLIENGPASGGAAVSAAFMAVASGLYDTVLVTGGEKMRTVSPWEVTDFVATLTHPEAEYIYGITLPALAGMFTRLYMEKYGVTAEHLAKVAIKNHLHALHNPYAHVQLAPVMEAILGSEDALVVNPYVADPLRFYDLCPVSDGAAALILSSPEVGNFKKPPVFIKGIGHATDTHTVHERKDPTDLTAVRLAAEKAYKMAGLGPKDVSVAELHDPFTILEIAESEEVGFFPKGEGHLALERGDTSLGGSIPINPSGGLKAKGHPVGATGVAQICELVWQLRGEAGKRQVKDAKVGLAVNLGGFGNNVVVTILAREE